MNELILSTDLQQIELEIQHHKNLAGQSIWEIGRRLNHVKENDLAHGSFGAWLKNQGFHQREAQRMMRIASELPKTTTWSHLGSRALYLIATLPEEERELEHTTSKGETKTPDEMTVRELNELKQELKEKDEKIKDQQQTINTQHGQLMNQPAAQVKVVEKEVTPEDYEDLKADRQTLEGRVNELQGELEMERTKYQLLESSTQEARQIEQTIKSLKAEKSRVTSAIELDEKLDKLHRFFDEEMSPMRFKPIINEIGTVDSYERLNQTIAMVELWAEEMRKVVPDNNLKIVEGIINE